MNRIFGYGRRDIFYINRLKLNSFFVLLILSFLLHIFVASAVNLKFNSDSLLKDISLIVDLQNEISIEQVNDFEKELNSLSEIKKIIYTDRKKSFRNLQNELNISIPESKNPLSDAFIVTLKNINSLEIIQEKLEANEIVKEVYINNEFINMNQNNGNLYKTLAIGCAIVSLILFITSFLIFSNTIAIDFLNSCNLNKNYKSCLKLSKIRSILPYLAATLVGLLLFFNVYIYARIHFLPKTILHSIMSWKELFGYNFVVFAAINFLAWIFPTSSMKYDQEETNFINEDEDLYEELFN